MDEILEKFSEELDDSEDYSKFCSNFSDVNSAASLISGGVLQPASSPYNIVEKIDEANIALFNTSLLHNKSSKVKFKEELVTYDTQLTDDDVVSIESDNTDVSSNEQNSPQILEYKTSQNVNIFDIEEEEEEIIEEIECELDNLKKLNNKYDSLEYPSGKVENEERKDGEVDSNRHTTIGISRSSRTGKRKKKGKYRNTIDCRFHCIERLDFDLSISIKKLSIQEKPPDCPRLKLLERKCCSENELKNNFCLPTYNGLRSEYGLSSQQLQKRERAKELIRLKEEKRSQLIQEYKKRKTEQNEEIFCKWLKDVSHRKALKQNIEKSKTKKDYKEFLSPNIIMIPNKNVCSTDRPKTANEFIPKSKLMKTSRPYSSNHCVYVEVPKSVLRRGIDIENMLNSFQFYPKKLHILTAS